MDPTIMAFAAILVGALCGVLVPYLLKILRDPDARPFDVSYLYTMILTIIVAAFAILPAPEMVDLSFRGIFTLFLAGLGLEGAMNKLNTMRINST